MTEELQLGPEFNSTEKNKLEFLAGVFKAPEEVLGRDEGAESLRALYRRPVVPDEKDGRGRQTSSMVDGLLSESAAGRTANDKDRLQVFQRLEAARAAAQGRGQTARRGKPRQG